MEGQITTRGARVRLEYTSDEYTRLVPGDIGTVTRIDKFGVVHVHWDSGSTLGLIPDRDRWTVLR